MSPAERRKAILAEALRVADGRRRKRLSARGGAAVCVVALAVSAIVILSRRGGDGEAVAPDQVVIEPASSRPATPGDSTPATRPLVVVQIIRAGDVRPRWETLSDDQFLAALADAGRPSGFVQLNGKTVIVPTP